MEINLLAVLLATIAMFVVGAVWYTVIFGKTWSKIHGFDKLSKAKQQEMMSGMGPIYGVQFAVTVLGALMLAKLFTLIPDYNPYSLAFIVWLGFAVPAHVSDTLFGGTESKWIITKILINVFATLAYLLVAVAVLSQFS